VPQAMDSQVLFQVLLKLLGLSMKKVVK
jgi:hypothetical protein